MLKHRIIPVLLTNGNGQCVKPIAFERPYRKLGTMEQYIRVIESRNVDELIIIDIEATHQKRKPDFNKLRSWCDNLFCPVTYIGGVDTLDTIQHLLENGADKVGVRTNTHIIYDAARKFGSQAIVGVIDTIAEYDIQEIYEGIVNYALKLETLGVGELVITDTRQDGLMNGYNTMLINWISEILDIPVIALGGCGEPAHMHEALQAGASAVAAGSLFLYSEETPKSCAEYLSAQGWPVRL